MTVASAFLGWFAAHPFTTFVAVMVVAWFIFDCFEAAQGMHDETRIEDEIQRRVAEGVAPIASVQEQMARVHALMVNDGLIRDPNAHERLGDVGVEA